MAGLGTAGRGMVGDQVNNLVAFFFLCDPKDHFAHN
jgi:hypothetical protein